MKLYTEEAIKAAIQIGLREKYIDDKDSDEFVDSVIKYFKSIELPTDDEMKHKINKEVFVSWFSNDEYERGFQDGAKWVIEQVKKQTNEKDIIDSTIS